MKLLGSTEEKKTQDKHRENVSHLEITKMTPVHNNLVNSKCQHDSRFLYTFVPNKPKIIALNTFYLKFSSIGV